MILTSSHNDNDNDASMFFGSLKEFASKELVLELFLVCEQNMEAEF
jgi:hypothetical protein